MHKITASATTVPQLFPTGTVAATYRFRFTGPVDQQGNPASMPSVLVPYGAPDPIQATSEVVPVPGFWTIGFALLDGTGQLLGPEVTAQKDVPADVTLRVAAGLTLQVITG
jgi:hypothetical protein